MSYSWKKYIIFIALISMIAISPSLCRKEKSEIEKDLRDLCSQTNKSKECWKIIKPELNKFNDTTDHKIVADVVLDMARTKGDEIHQELNRLYQGSTDDKLKYKYISCSKNYSDAIRNLILARRDLALNNYHYIPVQIDDTIEELEGCRLEFDKDSFDPAHIRNREKEFRAYVNIVKVATDRLLKRY